MPIKQISCIECDNCGEQEFRQIDEDAESVHIFGNGKSICLCFDCVLSVIEKQHEAGVDVLNILKAETEGKE